MSPDEFLQQQEEARSSLLTTLHELIIATDSSVTASVAPMMGHDMIQYKTGPHFKYALASGKENMSLHLMPIYSSPALYLKYKDLLPKARFQKSCINFKSAEAIPLDMIQRLLQDCARVDIAAIMEKYQQQKKSTTKKKKA